MPRTPQQTAPGRWRTEDQPLDSGANGPVSPALPFATRSVHLTTLVVWGTAAANPILTALAGLLVARSLTPAGYGHVAYFFAVYGLVVTFGSMGLTTRVTLDVARALGQGDYSAATEITHTLLTLRFATLVAIIGFSCVAAVFGNPILAAASIAGGMTLATGFLLGITQALGTARVAAGIQTCQALFYLGEIVAWADAAPERVFSAVIASWMLALLGALLACRDALVGWSSNAGTALKRWKGVILGSGQVYAVTLLLAPYSTIAVLALGSVHRFEEAALLSVSLSLALALSTIETTVLTVYYEPRLAHAIGSSTGGAFEWFDGFYRGFAGLSLAAAIVLATSARPLIALLFTERYDAGSGLLVTLAPGSGFLAVGQFMLWTLVAHGRLRWAFAGALAQLSVLVACVGLSLVFPRLPVYWLGVGHTLAAAACLTVCAIGTKRLGPQYRWHARRLAAALLAALASAALLRQVLPVGGTRIETAGTLILEAVVVCTLATALLAPRRVRYLARRFSEPLPPVG